MDDMLEDALADAVDDHLITEAVGITVISVLDKVNFHRPSLPPLPHAPSAAS